MAALGQNLGRLLLADPSPTRPGLRFPDSGHWARPATVGSSDCQGVAVPQGQRRCTMGSDAQSAWSRIRTAQRGCSQP